MGWVRTSILHARDCARCGEPFQQVSPAQIYCSHRCCRRVHGPRANAKKKAANLLKITPSIVPEDRGYTTPCHIWQRGKDKDGYGVMRHGGRQVRVHRFLYEQKTGSALPVDVLMDHHCRQHDCANLDHLEPVTCADNTRRGLSAKLSVGQARAIKYSIAANKDLMATFGVSYSTIRDIRVGRTWRDV